MEREITPNIVDVALGTPFKISPYLNFIKDPDSKNRHIRLDGWRYLEPQELRIVGLGRGWVHIREREDILKILLEIERVGKRDIPYISCIIRQGGNTFKSIKTWDPKEISIDNRLGVCFENWYLVGRAMAMNNSSKEFQLKGFNHLEFIINRNSPKMFNHI